MLFKGFTCLFLLAQNRTSYPCLVYVSATPSENTIHYYPRRGCVLAHQPDPELLALEPEDIHLVYAV